MKGKVAVLISLITTIGLVYWFILQPPEALSGTSKEPYKQQRDKTNDEVKDIRKLALNQNEREPQAVFNSEDEIGEEWCKVERNFSPQQRKNSQNEASEWDVQRGNILIPDYHSAFESHNAGLIAPYVDIEPDKLLLSAKSDDKFALITLLQRDDAAKEKKDWAAYRLMLLGNTSLALGHLVMKEVSLAKHKFAEGSIVTKEIENHMLNSLAYVSYGIARMDASALRAYVIATNPKHLSHNFSPDEALDKIDSAAINARKNDLVEFINSERAQLHLNPISDIKIPEIARKEFDISIAILYASFGSQIAESKNLMKISEHDLSRKSDCVSEFLSRLTQSS
ncbi:hypothetical protein [Salinimonas iocasae]|uniref:Uncharacterized protein n=1 Tax=Salinimonas iocasae TaxID=2572577 RepID=A0A5B7Y8K7_9ALTE|nr:hypothetical protein [Salinimonas iocasae]QCZ91961.1 hypothetical protein FBQ74_00025 [Salinimonas iocasae]